MNKHLYIFTESDGNGGGYGVGVYVQTLIDIFSRLLFYKITIVSVMTNGLIVKIIKEKNGLRKIEIPTLSPSTASRKNYFQSVYYILYPLIDKSDQNYFHFNFFSTSKLARDIKNNIENAKLLLTIHYFNKYDLYETGTNEDLENGLYDKVIVLNSLTEKELQQTFFVYPNKSTKILNGIKDAYYHLDKSKRTGIINTFGLVENKLYLLFVGRLDENKNVSLLIRVFLKLCSSYNNLHLNIVGSGDFDSALENVDKLWGKISFFGKIIKQEVYNLYQISDIGIIPSYYEELGYVPTEMLMHGISIIANETGGLSDLIQNNVTGLLVQLNNCKNIEDAEKLLYQKIEYLIINVKLRQRLGENARHFYLNNLTDKLFKEKMVSLYNSIT